MNRRQWIAASVVAALLIIVIVVLTVRGRGDNDDTSSPAPTSTSSGQDDPTEPGTTEPATPVPTTPDEVALAALSGLIAGENATACPMFAPEAYYLSEGPTGAVQEPISTWCPDGEPFGHQVGRNYEVVTSQVTTETARIGLEFEAGNGRSRVSVSLITQGSQWTVDRWCFYTGDYPNGTESMLGCLDGINE